MNVNEEIIKLNADIARLNQLLMEARRSGGGGGPGAMTFLDLTDTPNSYAGMAGDTVRVRAAENGLEFADRITTFLNLSDTPASFAGFGGYACRVNVAENAIEFYDASGLNPYEPDDFCYKWRSVMWRAIFPGGSTSVGGVGMTVQTSAIAGSLYDDTIWTQLRANTTVNNFSYIRGQYPTAAYRPCPKCRFLMRSEAAIANLALYCALSETQVTAAPGNTVEWIGLEYDTAVSGNWYYRTQDGSGAGGVTTGDTGVTVAVSTVYDLYFEADFDASEVRFYINDTLVATVAATLPAAGTPLYVIILLVNRLSGAYRYFDFHHFFMEYKTAA